MEHLALDRARPCSSTSMLQLAGYTLPAIGAGEVILELARACSTMVQLELALTSPARHRLQSPTPCACVCVCVVLVVHAPRSRRSMLDSMCPLKAVKCIAYTGLHIYTRRAVCQATTETCELNEYITDNRDNDNTRTNISFKALSVCESSFKAPCKGPCKAPCKAPSVFKGLAVCSIMSSCSIM